MLTSQTPPEQRAQTNTEEKPDHRHPEPLTSTKAGQLAQWQDVNTLITRSQCGGNEKSEPRLGI